MCGLVGEISRAQIDSTWLTAATRCLAHRGPDEEVLWTSSDQTVGLGHRRLAVLDLSTLARQPMSTSDGRITLALNGEIYNYKAVRDELRDAGYQFRSTGDTEVVLHAVAHWGERALEKLDGMFALAAYDARRRQLLLARDRVGEKPLYIWSR